LRYCARAAATGLVGADVAEVAEMLVMVQPFQRVSFFKKSWGLVRKDHDQFHFQT
jgi:hypothetical protein